MNLAFLSQFISSQKLAQLVYSVYCLFKKFKLYKNG